MTKDGVLGPPLPLKRNHEAMLRVIRRKKFNAVDLFFSNGFRITSVLAYDFIKTKKKYLREPDDDLVDFLTELEFLEAMTSPLYIISEAKHRSIDPVKRAFGHLHTTTELTKTKKEFNNTFEAMRATLEEFIVCLMEACNGTSQINLFLEQDDAIEGLSVEYSKIMPRINQALSLELKDFVTHDNCQQSLRNLYYDERYERVMDKGFWAKFIYIILELNLLPWYAFWFLLAKFDCPCCSKSWFIKRRKRRIQVVDETTPLNGNKGEFFTFVLPAAPQATLKCSILADEDEEELLTPCQRWANNLKVPVNRLICGAGFYALFIFWILMSIFAPNTIVINIEGVQIQLFDLLAGIWALGYWLSDLHMMSVLTFTVKTRKGAGICEKLGQKTNKFFSNSFLIYRFFTHFTYFAGLVTEYTGYYYKGQNQAVKMLYEADCVVNDPDLKQSMLIINVGICLQGIGIVLIFTEMLQVCTVKNW